MKFIATLILGMALCHADLLSAQADSKTASKTTDPNALSWRKDKKTAKKLLKKNKTESAIPYLEAGVQKKPKKAYFAERLAPAYLEVRDYKSSNKWYKALVDKDSVKHKKPAYLFEYGLTQKYLGQYEQSIATFTRYKKIAGDDDLSAEMKRRATRELLGSQKGIFYRDSITERAYKVKHLDGNINQPFADFAPRLRDGSLYYSSLRGDDAGSRSRIYKSPAQGKNWGPGEAISDNVNVPGQHVGNGSFSPDGNTLYYTECQTDKINKLKCRILKSTFANGTWSKGESAGAMINDPLFNNTQPAVGLNKDGDTVLYFVTDRVPGKGLDIYYAKINPDGSAGKPRPAGPQINSKGDEMSPYFDFKSKTLYFSSNGWISIGGQDVFKSTWDANGEWTEPENLGTPVNSSTDDIDFSINDKNTLGFIVSNRPGGFGLKSETCCDDIYEVETTKLFLAARGNVYQEDSTRRALADQGSVLLYDEKNGTETGSYNLIGGSYFFDLQPKTSYRLVTRKDGYYDGIASFNTNDNTDNDTMKYDLFLKKKDEVQVNPLIGKVIGRIYYDYDQARLKPGSLDTLKAVLNIMDQNPNIVVEVGAHTDGKGTEKYNIALSQKRAEAVINYYIHDKKVSSDRLVAKAYGPADPIAEDKTPDGKDNPMGRALNRRTEFKVLSELTADEISKMAVKKEPAPAAPANASKKNAATIEKIPTSKSVASKTSIAAPAKPAQAPTAKAVTPPAAGAPAPASVGYKTAPKTYLGVNGLVYMEKGGKRTLVDQAAVFLTTNEGGFTQKVYYVKADGAYSFDLSRSAADTFRLIARKYQFESNEVVLTPADLHKSNKPIDLTIKMK